MYRSRRINKNSIYPLKQANPESRPLETIDEIAAKQLKADAGPVPVSRPVILEDIFSKDENIPASQEPMQRYLSQRSINDGTLSRTQSRPLTQHRANTYFELVLMKVGVQTSENENFVLTCDHILFAEKLRETLVKSQNYPENVETFKTGIKDVLNVKSKLTRKFLNGCIIMIPGEEGEYQSQDSMMVNFFMVDFLREFVLNVLLDKIEEIACGNYQPHTIDDEKSLLILLLSQLRYVALLYSELIYKRIILIFGRCSLSAKWQIIANAESILDSRKHDEFAQIFLDNMPMGKDAFDLNAVQALTNLCLNSEMQNKLRNKMFNSIRDNQCPIKVLPYLIRFTLKILNGDTDEYIKQVTSHLRDLFICETAVYSDDFDLQLQIQLFNYIQQGLIRSKRLFDIWQKEIDALHGSNFKCIDFLILLMMIKIKEDRTLCIENIIRRRVILQQITDGVLQEAASKFHGILELYANILMRILNDFLRDKHKTVLNFVKTSYCTLFGIGDSVQKNILRRLLDFTCDKSSPHIRNIALSILQKLQEKYSKEVQKYGTLLMPLLDRVNEMSLQQTRLVMGFLCAVAYPPPTLPEYTPLQDQIDIVLKKQLISRSAFVKKQGIVGTVQLIYRIVRNENGINDINKLNVAYNTVSDLPEGNAKIAAQHVVRIGSCALYCPASLALFYNELASIFTFSSTEQADALHGNPFIIWLCELTTYYFQNSFVAEHSPTTTGGLSLSYQKCINTVDDINDEDNDLPSIAINIAERVLMPAIDASSSIIVLTPLFNLVRILHLQRYNGSLELINALLGCAIILPTFFDDPEEVFNNSNSELKEKILDVYFYCANWIREIVTSFITQREDMIRRKVLMRLSDLMKIERKIRELLLKAAPDYMPPMCGTGNPFGGSAQAKTEERNILKFNSRYDQKSKAATSTENRNFIGNNQKTSTIAKCFECLYGPKEIYRQMDSNIMLILRENFVIQYPLPEGAIGQSIGLLEYRFVLNDLVTKLEIISGVNEPTEYITRPLDFMMDLSKFLGYIGRNMDMLVAVTFEKLETIKYIYGHVDLFSESFNFLKINLALSFRLLAVFFSWFQYQNVEKKIADLLNDSLESLLDKSHECREKNSCEKARRLFNKYHKYHANILELESGVYLYRLLLSLKHLCRGDERVDETNTKNTSNEIRNLCKILLMRKWYDYDGRMLRGSKCNVQLNELVDGFLKNSDFRRQREILAIILEEAKYLNGKESSLKSFPNFRKANSSLLFRGLCEIFTKSLNDNIASPSSDIAEVLEVWEKSCELLNMQLEVLQTLSISSNFQFFLKHSHIYLKLVLQHALPTLEQFLSKDPERVSKFLKGLQITTRFLHTLCCHSKALKSTAILSQIPALRQTVETLVFRVKALLAVNNCTSVFWMGNLKNKDLHGDELLAQASSVSCSMTESDDEIPSDDASADETILSRTNSDRSTIYDGSNTDYSKSSSRSKCF